MKKLNFRTIALATFLGGTSLLSVSCKEKGCTDPAATNFNPDAEKDDESCEYSTENRVSGKITTNTTWTNDKIWILDGRVFVAPGATLTIEPGTIIKGEEGQETQASALIVMRGGKLMAQGTASNPIIFTSILDNIQIGQKVGTNLTKTDNEKWGGVAILGNAPISAQNGDTETNLEGIPEGTGDGLYGGNDAADNSGIISYISIRHGGISIGEGNELNGLTLGGVGSGTQISNVEVYATLDDGIECFGGTVDITNALVYYQGDDGVDIDMNYAGTIENFMVIHGDGIGTDEGLEIDGTEGSTYTNGLFTLKNGLVKSEGSEGSPGDFKDKAQGTVENVTFDYSSMGGKAIKIRSKYNNSCERQADAFMRLMDGLLNFTNCAITENVNVYPSYPTDASGNPTADCPTELAQDQIDANAEIDGTGSGHTVNASAFSWTCAGLRGQL